MNALMLNAVPNGSVRHEMLSALCVRARPLYTSNCAGT